MYGSASNIMNAATRELKEYSIVVASRSYPNSKGKFICCGNHAFPKDEPFWETAGRLYEFAPKGYLIVKVMCR
jgi:hypothetical protein